jgi:hypothetical protein
MQCSEALGVVFSVSLLLASHCIRLLTPSTVSYQDVPRCRKTRAGLKASYTRLPPQHACIVIDPSKVHSIFKQCVYRV